MEHPSRPSDVISLRKSTLSAMGVFLKDPVNPSNSFPSRVWTEFGYGLEEMSEDLWLSKIHPDDRERARRLMSDIRESAPYRGNAEYRVRDARGAYHWILSTGAIEASGDDAHPRFIGLDIDVTETHRLQHDLMHAQNLAEERAGEAEALRNAGAAIAGSLDRDQATDRVYDEFQALMAVEEVWVFEEAGREIRTVFGPDRSAGVDAATELPRPCEMFGPGECEEILFAAMRRRTPDSFRNPKQADQFWLVVPLVARGEVLGVLAVARNGRGSFSGRDTRLAMAMADYLALAIANARLYSKVRELAETDQLSGLLTRRELFLRGARLLEESRLTGETLTCILLDIDHFKSVNDRFGHQAGDVAIREVGRVLSDTVRAIDTVGRYGGEEFCALLPAVDAGEALSIAERIRERVRGITIDIVDTRITVSVGVATLSPDDDLDRLLGAADAALYRAKNAGRDCVMSRD